MDKNYAIGALVVVIIVGAGIWAWSNPQSGGTMATSTPATTVTTVTTNTGTNPTPVPARVPIVSTATGAAVSNSTAVVNGHVTPNGAQTSYWYQYGKTTSLGLQTNAQAIGSGFVAISAPGYITGLSANTQYYFRLVAKNSLGTINGATQSFTTNNTPPPAGNAPTTQSVAASGVTRTTANLNGRITPNSSDSSYWFEYGTSAELGNTTAFQSAGSGTAAASVSASLSDLAPATKYYFRMNAQNQYGTVNGAILSFTTSGPVAVSDPVVTTSAATHVGSTTATFNGNVNPEGASTTYWFEYSSDSLFGTILGNTTHKAVAGSGRSAVAVSSSVTDLTAGTAYFYRLVATNSSGTTVGDSVNFSTTE